MFHKNKKGFSLVEITIIVGIIAIMSFLSWRVLTSQKDVTQVEDAANVVASAINKTRAYALTGKIIDSSETVPDFFKVSTVDGNTIRIEALDENCLNSSVESDYVFETPIDIENAAFVFSVPNGELVKKTGTGGSPCGSDNTEVEISRGNVGVPGAPNRIVTVTEFRVTTSPDDVHTACDCTPTNDHTNRANSTCTSEFYTNDCGTSCPGIKTTGSCAVCSCVPPTDAVCVGTDYPDTCGVPNNCHGTKNNASCCTCNSAENATKCAGEAYTNGCGATCTGTKTTGSCAPPCTYCQETEWTLCEGTVLYRKMIRIPKPDGCVGGITCPDQLEACFSI